MRKYFYLLVLVLFVACKTTKNKEEEDRLIKMEIVKQGIKKADSYEYLYKFGKVDSSTKFLKTTEEFDKNGNTVKRLTYTRDEYDDISDIVYIDPNEKSKVLPVDSTIYVYDKKGNMIKSIETNYLSSIPSTVVTTSVYKYENEKKIESSEHMDGRLIRRTNYKYGSDGKLTEEMNYGATGNLDNKTVYSYLNGEDNGAKYYNMLGKLSGRSEIIRKDKNHVTSIGYSEKDVQETFSEYVYNGKGQVVETTYKGSDYFFKHVSTYNDFGLQTSVITYNELGEPIKLLKIETSVNP